MWLYLIYSRISCSVQAVRGGGGQVRGQGRAAVGHRRQLRVPRERAHRSGDAGAERFVLQGGQRQRRRIGKLCALGASWRRLFGSASHSVHCSLQYKKVVAALTGVEYEITADNAKGLSKAKTKVVSISYRMYAWVRTRLHLDLTRSMLLLRRLALARGPPTRSTST